MKRGYYRTPDGRLHYEDYVGKITTYGDEFKISNYGGALYRSTPTEEVQTAEEWQARHKAAVGRYVIDPPNWKVGLELVSQSYKFEKQERSVYDQGE